MNLRLQPDPTKVESVQDVLTRAAAKGLLGGRIPAESKKGKKEKGRKDHKDLPDNKPSSPSSHDGETGNELEDDQGGLFAAGHDEKRGEDEPEKGGKKRGTKGSKPKVKHRPRQSASASRKRLKDNRRAAKTKQQPQRRRHPRKKGRRKIPRLTLTLISSAKPSSCLSAISALAHKLSQEAAAEGQRGPEVSPPLLPSLPAATRRPNTDAGRAEKTLRSMKAGTRTARAKTVRLEAEVVTQVGSEATDLVLPPISRPSHSRSGTPISQHHSQASSSKKPASSSTSLLGS